MSTAIEALRHEHDAILFALKILDSMGRRAAVGDTIDRSDVNEFLGFLREFADKCHHGKEEGLLFPALIDAGLPCQGGADRRDARRACAGTRMDRRNAGSSRT